MPSTEPISWAGGITTLIETGLLMLISMGVIDITDDQVGQIMAFVVAVLGVVGPYWIARRNSTSLADPKVTLPSGDVVRLVREDNNMPTPQAMARGN